MQHFSHTLKAQPAHQRGVNGGVLNALQESHSGCTCRAADMRGGPMPGDPFLPDLAFFFFFFFFSLMRRKSFCFGFSFSLSFTDPGDREVARVKASRVHSYHNSFSPLVLHDTYQRQSHSCPSLCRAAGIRSCPAGSPCSSPSAAPSAGGPGR